ncbi:putative aromatic compound monooxygenase YhjG [Penicillium rolfsii]|nr:putative aromatic compound monooxygenase YhjG [Penicillium rolfsii]
MPETDVLVAGAGPTGLVLALWLHVQGVKVRIIDQADGPAPNSRALAVHARILELYRQLDLADELIERGYQLPATNVWVNGSHRAHINLRQFGTELTPYPYLLSLPQDEHERLLEKRLNSFGIFVERKTKLQKFLDNGFSITATLESGRGDESTCEAAYIVGCDGAHSVVRHGIGAKYEGDTYVPLLYIADIVAEKHESPLFNGEAHLNFVDETFNLIIPYAEERHVRLIGTTIPKTSGNLQNDTSEPHHEVTFEDVLPDIKKITKIDIKKVNWFSTYRSHHRVAEKFRNNRAFLVGDAAHIHSPVGGQGMNTGIMDAINLAWKLATVIKQPVMTEEAKNALLDTYEPERRSFALNVVGATDRGFTVLTSRGFFAHILRAWVIPYLVPLVIRFQAVRSQIFQRGSQLVCSYRGNNMLNQTTQGSETVQPGDRLPWVKTEQSDNFSTLRDICWQIHVYGDCRVGLEEWCKTNHVQFHVFEWNEKHGNAGFKKGAAYLLRPDQYIAGIFEGDDLGSELVEYFSTRGLLS